MNKENREHVTRTDKATNQSPKAGNININKPRNRSYSFRGNEIPFQEPLKI
jgi:hypothetical protein